MGLAFVESETEYAIRLEGVIDISSASELKDMFLQALGSGRVLRVSLGSVACIDLTAVQLLWAAGQQARRSGGEFHLTGQLPEPVSMLLADAGLQILTTSSSDLAIAE